MFQGTSDYEENYRKQMLVAVLLEKFCGEPAGRRSWLYGEL